MAVLFTMVKTWNQPWCPSAVDQRKEMWYIRTAEHYTVIKNKYMPLPETWTEPQAIMNKRQEQKTKIFKTASKVSCEYSLHREIITLELTEVPDTATSL